MARGDYTEERKKIYSQGLYEESSVAKERVGTIRKLDDGRVFIYTRAGAVALAAGKLCQAAIPVANHVNKAIAVAAAVGDKSVTVTLGATAATVNQYKDGFLYINDAAGEGYMYKVSGHPAADASASLVVQLYDGIRYALTTSSEYTLVASPFSGAIIHDSPPTAVLIGIPPIAITANYYYWSQVKGMCIVLSDGTPAIGTVVIPSTSVDGSVATPVLTEGTPNTGLNQQGIGALLNTGVDTEYKMIMLSLPGF